jgi:hypothetical protein
LAGADAELPATRGENDDSAERFVEASAWMTSKSLPVSPMTPQPPAIDDVIFFANDPTLPPEPEAFPNCVTFSRCIRHRDQSRLAAIRTGGRTQRCVLRAARAVPRKDGQGKLVGPRH